MLKQFILGVFLACPYLLFAQGFQVNLQGQKQIGMVGAGTGAALDEAALFFNPGAVSMLPKNSVSAGLSPVFFKSSFQQEGSFQTEHNKDEVATPFTFYGVWGPAAQNYKIGLAVYTPFGGLNNWGGDWSGRYSVTSLDLKAIYVQPTFSWQILPHLGIGAGFVYNRGSVNLQRRIPLSNNQGEAGTATLKGNGDGFGWNAGIFYQTNFGLSVGLSHRSKVVTKLENGDADFDFASALPYPQHTGFNAELPLPATTSLGFSYQVSPKTLLLLDANYVHWRVYQSLDFYYDDVIIGGDDESHSARNYHDSGAIRFGGQYQHNEQWTFRAGLGYAFTPVDAAYVTPEVPDANRLLLSAGLGYQANDRFRIDASFLFEGVERRSSTNAETQLSGTFKSNVFVPGISLTYQW